MDPHIATYAVGLLSSSHFPGMSIFLSFVLTILVNLEIEECFPVLGMRINSENKRERRESERERGERWVHMEGRVVAKHESVSERRMQGKGSLVEGRERVVTKLSLGV